MGFPEDVIGPIEHVMALVTSGYYLITLTLATA